MRKIIIISSLLLFTLNSCFNSGQSVYIIEHFENNVKLDFPPSGKIIERNDNGAALDWWCYGVIEMDTIDYMNILHKIQMRSDSLSTDEYVSYRSFKLRDSETEYAHFEEHRDSRGMRYWLSFHKNKRFIKCFFESI